MNMESTVIGVTGGTPTGANTVTLFNSYTAFLGTILAAMGIKRLMFSVKNDQAGTLKFYKSKDGTTFDQVGGSIAVGIPAATDISGPYDFLCEGYWYVKLDWLNGGVDQTTWRAELVGSPFRVKGN
jgi:hypothetical protein